MLCACIAIYAIWTLRVSKTRSDELLEAFKKTDQSLQRSNDSLQKLASTGAFKKDSFHLPEVELAIRANAIFVCIDSIKHDLIVLANKNTAASFSYPDTARLLYLKNNLQHYNSFIQQHFAHKPAIRPADLVRIDDEKIGAKPIPWEVHYFQNTTVLSVITVLTYVDTQVQKLQHKATR